MSKTTLRVRNSVLQLVDPRSAFVASVDAAWNVSSGFRRNTLGKKEVKKPAVHTSEATNVARSIQYLRCLQHSNKVLASLLYMA